MRTYAIACAALLVFAGCDRITHPPRPLAKTATFELYHVSAVPSPTSKPATDPDTKAAIFLSTPAIITTADIATIQLAGDSPEAPGINVTLTPAGATKLAAATSKPAGMEVAIVVNGNVIAVPKVRSRMSSSFSFTSGVQKQRDSWFAALTQQ